jgi:hypothetical protein
VPKPPEHVPNSFQQIKKKNSNQLNRWGENCNTHQDQLPTTLPSNAATTNTTNV